MPDNKEISALTTAEQTSNNDLLETSIPNAMTTTGYISRKQSVTMLEQQMLGNTQYNTELPNFTAGNRTIFKALEEARSSGGGGASVIQKTMAEYTALPSADKMNGSIYKITDKALIYCLDEEYHAVLEITSADYAQLTSAEKNNGTIYIKTDAETTGEDIQVSSTDTRTIDEGIADADGQVIDYATWSAMTPQEQVAAGKVYVPDFPTATPNATEIPMSSSNSTSVADKIDEIVANANTIHQYTASYIHASITQGNIYAYSVGKIYMVTGYMRANAQIASDTVIGSVTGVTLANEIFASSVGSSGSTLRLLNYTDGRLRIEKTMPANEWFSYTIIGFLA